MNREWNCGTSAPSVLASTVVKLTARAGIAAYRLVTIGFESARAYHTCNPPVTNEGARFNCPISKMISLLDVDLDNDVKLAPQDLLDRLDLVAHSSLQGGHVRFIFQSTLDDFRYGCREVQLKSRRTVRRGDLLGDQFSGLGLEPVFPHRAVLGVRGEDGGGCDGCVSAEGDLDTRSEPAKAEYV